MTLVPFLCHPDLTHPQLYIKEVVAVGACMRGVLCVLEVLRLAVSGALNSVIMKSGNVLSREH